MTTYYSYRYAMIHGNKCRRAAEQHRAIKENTYFGSLCKKCETNLRFSDDRECVLCSELSDTHSTRGNVSVDKCRAIALNKEGRPIDTMHSDRKVRKAAELVGMEIYYGMKCDDCGGFHRYTNRGRCMGCVNERNRRYQAVKRRTARRPAKKKTAPAQTRAAVEVGAVETFDDLFD